MGQMTQVLVAIIVLAIIYGTCGIYYALQKVFNNCYFWMPNKIYHRCSGCKLIKVFKTISMFIIYLIICCAPIVLFILFILVYVLYLLFRWFTGKIRGEDRKDEIDIGSRLLKRGIKEALDIPYDEFECADIMEEFYLTGGTYGSFSLSLNKENYIDKFGQEAYDMWIARKKKNPFEIGIDDNDIKEETHD